jgi:hypothetical protein
MPDAGAGDDSGIALDANLRRKLAVEARLRREITDEVLRGLAKADAAMRSGKRGAALLATAEVLKFVGRLAALDRDLGRFSCPAPDMTLARIAHALAGLEEGTVDPILVPDKERRRRVVNAAEDKYQGNRAGSTANVLAGHATAAAAMTILMLAGCGRKDAAQQVVDILKDTPLLADSEGEPWRTVARWRDEIVKRAKEEKRKLPDMQGQGVDFRAETVGRFNYLIGEAQRLEQDGAPPEALVRIAHDLLDHGLGMGENSGLARAKSARPEV